MMDEQQMATIYDRLRETEAQTREQNIRINSLCEKIDSFSNIVDRFFAVEEKRSERMWKVIAVLAGAVVSLAIGPKAATKIFEAWRNGQAVSHYEAIPWSDRDATTRFTSFVVA